MSNMETRVSKRKRSGGYARRRVELYAIVVIVFFVLVIGMLFGASYLLDPTVGAETMAVVM